MKILLLIFSISFSQSLMINVSDEENNTPLKDANIVLTSPTGEQIGKSTDSDGQSTFKNLNLGEYKINISFIGYEKVSTTHLLKEQNQTKYFKLKLKSILIPELNIIGDLNSQYKNLHGAGSAIDETTIRKINPIGTQELLEYIPGIQTVADDGIGNSRISVGIRGLNPRRSSRVLILEDGIPIQPALYVYPNMYYNPPVERIDGVQVIKGSGVIKYGPQTMGGIINYNTRRPSQNFNGFTDMTIGENGYLSLFTELNGLSFSKTKNAFQLLYKRGDGFRQNNSFVQYNGTFKSIYNISDTKNIYSKISINHENSNATYTGLTEYSFKTNPTFNPKDDDYFSLFRFSIDIIETEKLNSSFLKTRKFFSSYFDRNWWRETDIFVEESNPGLAIDHLGIEDALGNIIRIGNGESNFGILRKFYVIGYEQTYKINNNFSNLKSETDLGFRGYFERFIDDKKIGDAPDARDGIYYYPAETWVDLNGDELVDLDEYIDLNDNNQLDEIETIVGQSHHYETTALSGFISNKVELSSLSINMGLRLELFEQIRIDLLDGSSYLDNSTFVLLPSISFIKKYKYFNLFGGVHKGYTAPSSGALKVSNFALDTGLDLKAETSWNKEIGIRVQDFKSFLSLELSAFHLDIKNLVAAGRGAAFKNLGKVESMGTELSSKIDFLQYPLLPSIYFSHTFLQTNIKSGLLEPHYFMGTGAAIDLSGNSLPYSPKNTFLVGIEYESIKKRMNLRFDLKYVDRVFTDFHNILEIGQVGIKGPVEAYSIINCSLSYQLSKNILINISGKNLLDKIYIGSRLHSNPNQTQADISSGILPGPRRQINFSLKYTL